MDRSIPPTDRIIIYGRDIQPIGYPIRLMDKFTPKNAPEELPYNIIYGLVST